MAGAGQPYDHLPFFYSDLFELGYEAVGDVDSRLDHVASGTEPNRKGVVAYVDGAGRARGFLLWDVWGKVDSARELIRLGHGRGLAASRSPWTEASPRQAPARDERDRHHVEDHVPARCPARRIPLWDAEAGNDPLPRPGSDRRPVDLEPRDDEEDARVDGPARLEKHEDEEGAADRAGQIGRRKHGMPSTAQTEAPAMAVAEEDVGRRAASAAREKPHR